MQSGNETVLGSITEIHLLQQSVVSGDYTVKPLLKDSSKIRMPG